MLYSIIVAVYNRPSELQELLSSLCKQTFTNFELVIVEDGSTETSKAICDAYSDRLSIAYYFKENSGPGPSRNYGCRRASGDFFLFLDSDCTIPPHYMQAVHEAIEERELDAFGGPDKEDDSFSDIQKAISYSMTSFLTTGGIRGGKLRVGGAFHPRSFNMGISRNVFNETDGFANMRFGEDVEFSIRMIEGGFTVQLVSAAWVYHKRRADLKKFFKQVHNSGMARIDITLLHPSSLKITHFFPAAFLAYIVVALVYTVFVPEGHLALFPLLLYIAAIFVDSLIRFHSIKLGLLSVCTSITQHVGYGMGFTRAVIMRVILGRKRTAAFEKTFYN
ncbi:MAG: glycosyltransferase [Ignavibacteria bacterium]|nr:glycosyltransferase [Ignavibacteria bacterium]